MEKTVILKNVLSTSDYLGGGLALVLNSIAAICLLGLMGILIIGAFTKRDLITSWSNEEERTFIPHESYMSGSHSKSWLISLVTSGIFAVFMIGVYFGVTPEIRDMTKGMNMENLQKPKKKEVAPAPDKAAAPAPAAEKAAAPAEKPADKPAEKTE